MRIYETLRHEPDATAAVIEVEANEVADLDQMLLFVDGAGGDYSMDARLVSTGNPPKIEYIADHWLPVRQRKFAKPAEMRLQKDITKCDSTAIKPLAPVDRSTAEAPFHAHQK